MGFKYVKQFGETNIKKTDNTGLFNPEGCSIDSNGNVYITDTYNHRLIKLNKDLQYVSQFGVTGTLKKDNTGLYYPSGCCVDSNGDIYIADYTNNRLVKLNSNLEYVSQFGTTGTLKKDNTGLYYPSGCCVDSNDNIYIADTSNHRLIKLNKDLQYVSQFGVTGTLKKDNTGLNKPSSCCVDCNGDIYITDIDNNRLVKLNKDLQYISQFGETGVQKTDNTGLNRPEGCCIDSTGNIYIADSYNHRLVKLNKDLQYVSQFGETRVEKTDSTGLQHPSDCCVDSNGNICIADFYNQRLVMIHDEDFIVPVIPKYTYAIVDDDTRIVELDSKMEPIKQFISSDKDIRFYDITVFDKFLYIGTNKGLLILDRELKQTNFVSSLTFNSQDITIDNIYALTNDTVNIYLNSNSKLIKLNLSLEIQSTSDINLNGEIPSSIECVDSLLLIGCTNNIYKIKTDFSNTSKFTLSKIKCSSLHANKETGKVFVSDNTATDEKLFEYDYVKDVLDDVDTDLFTLNSGILSETSRFKDIYVATENNKDNVTILDSSNNSFINMTITDSSYISAKAMIVQKSDLHGKAIIYAKIKTIDKFFIG